MLPSTFHLILSFLFFTLSCFTGTSSAASVPARLFTRASAPATTSSGAPLRSYVIGYYFGEDGPAAIDRIDFSKLSHVMYAFAIPNADGFINITTIEQHLPKMVSAANSKGAEVSLSIGGWIGSKDISPMIANEKSRSAFIKNAADLADKYGVHLDIDYESPGERSNGDPDNGGTKFDTKHDTDNYLKLLQDLRKELDNRASANSGNKRRTQLSIAAFPHTFLSSDGRTYLNDMTEWAKVVDFVQIMAYDMGSNDPKVIAPHAPFESTDGRTTSSFTQAIDAWTNAKWPANQIVVGIPFYGRSFTAKVDIAKNPNDIYVERSPTIPRGDNDDSESFVVDPDAPKDQGKDRNGKPKPPKLKGEFSGVWRYRNLVSQGVLKDANVAGEGWTLGSDKVSKSPFLFNETSKDFITFDSVDSIKAKAAFARKRGIAGVMAWQLSHDTDDGTLVTALNEFRQALNNSDPSANVYPGKNGNGASATAQSTTSLVLSLIFAFAFLL